jgi:four helix bundle protein
LDDALGEVGVALGHRDGGFASKLVLVLVIGLGIVLVDLATTVPHSGRLAGMGFEHERLDVCRVTVELIAWVGDRLDGSLKNARMSATRHLAEASQSIANNIAEGNGKRSRADRCRVLDRARGSALECAACLDALAARKRITFTELADGKQMLERIVSMRWKMIEAFQPESSPKTNEHATPGGSPRPKSSPRPCPRSHESAVDGGAPAFLAQREGLTGAAAWERAEEIIADASA